jgi:DnaK suppressor protein
MGWYGFKKRVSTINHGLLRSRDDFDSRLVFLSFLCHILHGFSGKKDATSMTQPLLPPDYIPKDQEPYMSELMLAYFREKLLLWKKEIIRESTETLDHLRQEELRQPDDADRATLETEQEIELRTRDRQRKLLGKIDLAIARIDSGDYGYCEETGEPIGVRRLLARPIATLCIEAQERHERHEKTHREDEIL